MSKKGKKDEQEIYVCFECNLCKTTLIRSVQNEKLKEMEQLRLREQHLELHRLAEIGNHVIEIRGLVE